MCLFFHDLGSRGYNNLFTNYRMSLDTNYSKYRLIGIAARRHKPVLDGHIGTCKHLIDKDDDLFHKVTFSAYIVSMSVPLMMNSVPGFQFPYKLIKINALYQ